MSSHLRHCPKHRKPLPCPHCAMIQKPAAVAVVDPPASDPPVVAPEPAVVVCPPKAAKAKPISKAEKDAIPAEIRRGIEGSLAPPPNTIPPPKPDPLSVETSFGEKTIDREEDDAEREESNDEDIDVEREAELEEARNQEIDDNNPAAKVRVVPKSERLKSQRLMRRNEPKQPSYLKSVSQPVVSTGNPGAPYGLDENGKPLQPMRSDIQIAQNLLEKPHLLEPERPVYEPCTCKLPTCTRCNPVTRVNVSSISEDVLRRQWGVSTYDPKKWRNDNYTSFVYYPAMLGLSRQALVELLDVPVDAEAVECLDRTQPKQKTLKSTGSIKMEVNTLQRKIDDAVQRRAAITEEIAESERVIESMSVRVQKAQVKRGERDEILDTKTREMYKRKEKNKIEQLEAEHQELNKSARVDKEQLAALQERLANWGSRPEDYDLEYPRITRLNQFLFRDKFVLPDRENFKGLIPEGYEYGLGAWAQLVYLYGATDTFLAEMYSSTSQTAMKMLRKSPFFHWRPLENEIVLQLIGWGLIQPSRALLAKHPTLTRYVDFDYAANEEQDEVEADTAENVLIIKTGGAAIGGQVYGSGKRWNGRQRGLSTFDGAIGGKGANGGGASDAGNHEANDSEAHQPD